MEKLAAAGHHVEEWRPPGITHVKNIGDIQLLVTTCRIGDLYGIGHVKQWRLPGFYNLEDNAGEQKR